MVSDFDVLETLKKLGTRLRQLRIDRGDTMEMMATRLGISVPTLRSLEKGSPKVMLGVFAHAFSVHSRLHELDQLAVERKISFDMFEAKKQRKRARRKPTGSE